MLQSLDYAFREFNDKECSIPVKRFTLIPNHSCGGTMSAAFTGSVRMMLLPKIKKSHPDFYKHVKSLPKPDQTKLVTCFKYEMKNGWNKGRQVRSNGIKLDLLYEKNKQYMVNGRPKRQKSEFRTGTSDFELPKNAPVHDLHDIAAVDKGYHNLYSVARLLKCGKFATRTVTKKWFDRRCGRVVTRKRSKHLTSRAQSSGILKAITNTTLKTVDPVDFLLALQARLDSYDVLYEHYSNRRFKKEKLA